MATKPRVPFFVPIFNRVAERLLRLGRLLGPNALLTVPGRRTGQPRTTPVALVDVGGRRWIAGVYGDVDWVRNLRAAGEGTLTVGRHQERIRAVELSRDDAETFFARVLDPFIRRLPIGTWLIGSVLHARDILEDPHGAAQRVPVFELHPAGG